MAASKITGNSYLQSDALKVIKVNGVSSPECQLPTRTLIAIP